MKHLVALMVAVFAAGPSAAFAQTVYNSPSQSGTPSVQPLNMRALLRGNQGAGQQPYQPAVPYVNSARPGASFEQQMSALDQWRAERDARSRAEIESSHNEMVAFATSTGPQRDLLLNNAPVQNQAGAISTAPAVPVFYRNKDNDGIAKPRRLFNRVE